MKSLIRLLILSAACAAPVAWAQPAVVATIKPLQLIAAAVTEGAGRSGLLMRPGASPHHYALRPSERQALEDAEVLLWVGPELESQLADLVPELDADAIAAASLPGVQTLSLDHGIDPHLWLDSTNARAIAAALADELAARDPRRAQRYRDNLARFNQALDALDLEISRAADQLPRNAYGVYHNAFRYFEDRYNLDHVVSFTGNEETKPGIRRLLNIKRSLEDSGARCILVEPSVNVEEIHTVLGLEGMRYRSVDVLGAGVPMDAQGYPALLRQVADTIFNCIEGN